MLFVLSSLLMASTCYGIDLTKVSDDTGRSSAHTLIKEDSPFHISASGSTERLFVRKELRPDMPEGEALTDVEDREEKMKLGLRDQAAHPEAYLDVAKEVKEKTETAVEPHPVHKHAMLAGTIFGVVVNLGIVIAGVAACLMTRSQDMKALQAARGARAQAAAADTSSTSSSARMPPIDETPERTGFSGASASIGQQ